MKNIPHKNIVAGWGGEQEIHTHIIHPHQIENKKCNHLLDTYEQQRSRSFVFDKDRMLYSASHIFLRQILSRYASVNPEDWQFSYDAFGKPAISSPGYASLKFNLSHTHSMIACAISYGHELGVDIERHRTLGNFTDMCRLVLSEQERRHLLPLALPQQESLFFRYWTLKEACVKALGKGLTIPLHSIQYEPANSKKWQCTIDSTLKAGDLYSFYYTIPQDSYSLALAARINQRHAVPVIRLFDWSQKTSTPRKFNARPSNLKT